MAREDFDGWLDRELRRTVGGLRGPAPDPARAAYASTGVRRASRLLRGPVVVCVAAAALVLGSDGRPTGRAGGAAGGGPGGGAGQGAGRAPRVSGAAGDNWGNAPGAGGGEGRGRGHGGRDPPVPAASGGAARRTRRQSDLGRDHP